MKLLRSEYYDYVDDVLREESIHEQARVDGEALNVGLFLILSFIATVLHAINAWLFASGAVWVVVPIIFHVILAAIPAFIASVQIARDGDARYYILLASTTFVGGIFGAAGSFLCVALYSVFSQRSMSFDDWFGSIFPDDDVTLPEEVYDDIQTGEDENPIMYGVMPFEEVMRIGNEDQKRRALSRMTVNFDPRFSPAILSALKDQNNNIRVQAATSVARIESQFGDMLVRIEEAKDRSPNNPRITNVLARFYDDYSFTGLLDDERERLNRARAAELYKQYLEHDPNNADVWLAVGRLYYRSGELTNAVEWFEQSMQRGHNIHNIHKVLPWYLEALYKQGRFSEIRSATQKYANQLKYDDAIPAHIKSAARLWITEPAMNEASA